MKKLENHSRAEWDALWTRIEEFGVMKLALRLGYKSDNTVRNWKSRGAVPKRRWRDIERIAGVPWELIAPSMIKGFERKP